jgi:hypothetical protein
LLNAGLAEDRREGLWVYYRIAQPRSRQQRLVLKALCSLLRDVKFPDITPELRTMRAERCSPSTTGGEAPTSRSGKLG